MMAVPRRFLQLAHQVEDLRLDRDVQRGGRFVGDQQLGIARQRHGDHHALAHAAGQLVRIGVHTMLRLGNMHAAQHFDRLVHGVAAGQALVQRDRLADLPPTVITGLSEVIGSWKIIEMSLPRMRSISASVRSSRFVPSSRTAPPAIRPGGLEIRRRIGQRGHALAAAGFADDAQRLTAPHGVGHAVDRPDHAGRREEMRLEIVDLQQRLGRGGGHGLHRHRC